MKNKSLLEPKTSGKDFFFFFYCIKNEVVSEGHPCRSLTRSQILTNSFESGNSLFPDVRPGPVSIQKRKPTSSVTGSCNPQRGQAENREGARAAVPGCFLPCSHLCSQHSASLAIMTQRRFQWGQFSKSGTSVCTDPELWGGKKII